MQENGTGEPHDSCVPGFANVVRGEKSCKEQAYEERHESPLLQQLPHEVSQWFCLQSVCSYSTTLVPVAITALCSQYLLVLAL